MDRNEMQSRVKAFAIQIVRLSESLPQNNAGWVLGKQLIKSGTSIGANYYEALRSSSQAHFISIIEIALREASETKYWLEILSELCYVEPAKLSAALDECDQLVRILTATARTAKQRLQHQHT
jgi:four helix bundle protein